MPILTCPTFFSSIRNAAVDVCGFDRVGLLLCDTSLKTVFGTWGTDERGFAVDIHDLKYALDEEGSKIWGTNSNEPYI